MRPAKPCLVCNKPQTFGSFCRTCWAQRLVQRDEQRGTPAQRGYTYGWRKLSRERVAAIGYCERCLTTGDLTLDHAVPLVQGGQSDEANAGQVLCRRCNSRKAAG